MDLVPNDFTTLYRILSYRIISVSDIVYFIQEEMMSVLNDASAQAHGGVVTKMMASDRFQELDNDHTGYELHY